MFLIKGCVRIINKILPKAKRVVMRSLTGTKSTQLRVTGGFILAIAKNSRQIPSDNVIFFHSKYDDIDDDDDDIIKRIVIAEE